MQCTRIGPLQKIQNDVMNTHNDTYNAMHNEQGSFKIRIQP